MDQNPSREANSLSASRELLHLLWNPKDRYRVHKNLWVLHRVGIISGRVYSMITSITVASGVTSHIHIWNHCRQFHLYYSSYNPIDL